MILKEKKKFWQKEYAYFLLFTGAALLGFLLFYLYPIIRTLILSFTDKTIYKINFNFIKFDNYVRAFKDTLFLQSIKQSFIFAFFSGIAVLVTSLILAMLLSSKLKGIGVFKTIYMLPFIIPSFAVGAVYKNFFNPYNGFINEILSGLGVKNLPLWYAGPETALMTMIIISSMGFGVKMLVFLAALQGVSKEYYEAAMLDGATKWRRFTSITLPLISPMLFFNVILITIDGLKSFNLAFVMGNGNGDPSNSTLLFPIYMFRTAFSNPFELGYASAMSYIFFVVILILTGAQFLLSKLYVEKDIA